MTISLDFSAAKQTRWYEYAVRFVLGGAISLAAGLLAKSFGPEIGGLFLAFPAIFPASATLIEKHESEKKRKAGIPATSRALSAAALDARGAALGGIGLAIFAVTLWQMLTRQNAAIALSSALLAWLVSCVVIWKVWKLRHRFAPKLFW